MRNTIISACIWLLSIPIFLSAPEINETPEFRLKGVQINVSDLDQALNFYHVKLGFPIEEHFGKEAQLKTNSLQLYLKEVAGSGKVIFPKTSQTILVFHTNDLDSAMIAYEKKGIQFIEGKRENGVGFSAKFTDPFGNVFSLLEQSKYPVAHFTEPAIYNVGYYLPDISTAQKLYCDILGFKVRSTAYLPSALPLNHKDGSFAFMLHEREIVSEASKLDIDDSQTIIIFETTDLNITLDYLHKQGVQLIRSETKNEDFYLKGPYGNLSRLIES